MSNRRRRESGREGLWDRIDFTKDATIAFLSSSALLLTLILALISLSLARAKLLMWPLVYATAALYATILISMTILMVLASIVERSGRGQSIGGIYWMLMIQFVPFAFGLVCICISIISELSL